MSVSSTLYGLSSGFGQLTTFVAAVASTIIGIWLIRDGMHGENNLKVEDYGLKPEPLLTPKMKIALGILLICVSWAIFYFAYNNQFFGSTMGFVNGLQMII